MKILLYILMFCFPLIGSGQTWKRKPKNSMGRGTLFISWGYNGTGYTKSELGLEGPGYDFSLAGAKAQDDDLAFVPSNNYGAQFNARIGYNIRNYFALSAGWDRTHYLFNDQNNVLLSGTINPGVDVSGNWNGDYTNTSVVTDNEVFNYANTLNFFTLEAMRTDQWFRVGENFGFTTNFGVGLGAIMTRNDYLFSGQQDIGSSSLSGYVVNAQAGLRFEFFRHLFLSPTYQIK
jgi:hypothetical protein